MSDPANQIETSVELQAPPVRVWQAVTSHTEFGAWFGVKLEAPFVPGQLARGQITSRGYEHIPWLAVVRAMEPERLFSYTWHPFAIDTAKDYSGEVPTLVEFRLEPTTAGTHLTLIESGFDHIPAARREEAYTMHVGGWAQQMKNIAKYLDSNAANPN